MYKDGEPVGKSCDQVGRTSDGFTSGNSGIYDKWAQALNSAADLIDLACTDGRDQMGNYAFTLVIPILVVPNERLWRTEYNIDGSRKTDPERVDRCSYFIGRTYTPGRSLVADEVTISHMEIVTSKGLMDLIEDLGGEYSAWDRTFHCEEVVRRLRIMPPRT